MVFGAIASAVRIGGRLISNALSKVTARSPVSGTAKKVVAGGAGGRSPVLQSRLANNAVPTITRSPRLTRTVFTGGQSRVPRSTARRVVTSSPFLVGSTLAAGAAFDALSGEGGTTAGATVGGALGGLTPGGRIKRIGKPILTTAVGGIAGNEGADIAEAQNLGAANIDQPQAASILATGVDDPIASSTESSVPTVSRTRRSTPKRSKPKTTKSTKRKSTKRKSTKRSKGSSNQMKVRKIFKESGKKWRKMSKAQKAKFENKFSDFVKVEVERKIAAKK